MRMRKLEKKDKSPSRDYQGTVQFFGVKIGDTIYGDL